LLPYKSSSFLFGPYLQNRRYIDRKYDNWIASYVQRARLQTVKIVKVDAACFQIPIGYDIYRYIIFPFLQARYWKLTDYLFYLLFSSYRQWQYNREKDPFEIRLPIVLASFKRFNRMRWQNACDTSPFGLDNSIVGMEWLSRCITLIAFVPTVIKRWKNFENDIPGPLIK